MLFWTSFPAPFRSWCMWAFWQRNPVMCSVQKCWRVARLERWSNGQTSWPLFMCWDITSRYHSQSKNCRGESLDNALTSRSQTFALVLFMIWWPEQMCASDALFWRWHWNVIRYTMYYILLKGLYVVIRNSCY